ncbi:mycofactocin oligosaccharide methyltransferase MftM [Mycolicibacterium hippocampi]|uniref:SAM-dependent methyltransferase n=2 Tax=Mycolicibacterium hippocampi TaxID=659824 RepID=A0A7I9ZGY5_9MYCO|nr:SAM-dependent methyltransferase [Mycolicibacterium hippocampi]
MPPCARRELAYRAVTYPAGQASHCGRSVRALPLITPIALPCMQAAVLDPLAPTPRGTWSGRGVRVTRRHGPHRPHTDAATMCAPRFCVQRHGRTVIVEHDLTPEEICDELTVMLAESGTLRGRAEFEMVFTGIVRSTIDGALPAWLRFYRNSLDQLESDRAPFAPIHARAASQVRGHHVIDLGSCFGFFPLRLAQQRIEVLATDLSLQTMQLLDRVSTRLQRPLSTLACDATAVPLPDRTADTVTALHLIEHLPVDAAEAALDEAVRLARRRVVIAVPFEDELGDCYGHVQQFDRPSLELMAQRACGRHRGITARIHTFHGGWLILDR